MDRMDDRLAGLVGRRVALRHKIDDAGGTRPGLTDAVGDLADGGDGTVIVHTSRGPVRVERRAVVAVRAVPPAPPRRPSLSAVVRLEQLCADAWPPVVRRDVGDWRLRAAGGFTHRANSALAAGDPGMPVEQALAEVRRFSDEHAIPPVVATPSDSPWSRRVLDAGWVLEGERSEGSRVAALVADLPRLAATGGARPADGTGGDRPGPAGVTVSFAAEPEPDWWALFGESDRDPVAADRRRVLVPGAAGPQTGFGLARRGGEAVGAVRACVVDDHVYLSRLQTSPAARRSGIATRLTAAAAAWGRDAGARWAVLQVGLHNQAARALYARMGCTEHHRYHYLVPGPDATA